MIKQCKLIAVLLLTIVMIYAAFKINDNSLPVIAIANYGPHPSLDNTIKGFKMQMRDEGFVENKTIRYITADVGFDSLLIPQMLLGLKAKNPRAMLALTTPVAQSAKNTITDIPVIYTAITDPVEAGLLANKNHSHNNITGSSDMQNPQALLQFIKSLLPTAKTIGLLYATSESNDVALVKMMRKAATNLQMNILAVPIEQAQDVPVRVNEFKNRVDLIYVGSSGPIQPTLPAIAKAARKMHIPVLNMDAHAVREGLVPVSFGVNYESVGRNAGKLVAAALHGENILNLTPIYPGNKDHYGVIHKQLAGKFKMNIPLNTEITE